MFTISNRGWVRYRPHLYSSSKLEKADFQSIARTIGQRPFAARKVAMVAARQASAVEPVETRWNGKESSDVAQPGDWIVTSLTRERRVMRDKAGSVNTYVIRSERFPELYARATGTTESGDIYSAIGGEVQGLTLRGGFDIQAPWGERQT